MVGINVDLKQASGGGGGDLKSSSAYATWLASIWLSFFNNVANAVIDDIFKLSMDNYPFFLSFPNNIFYPTWDSITYDGNSYPTYEVVTPPNDSLTAGATWPTSTLTIGSAWANFTETWSFYQAYRMTVPKQTIFKKLLVPYSFSRNRWNSAWNPYTQDASFDVLDNWLNILWTIDVSDTHDNYNNIGTKIYNKEIVFSSPVTINPWEYIYFLITIPFRQAQGWTSSGDLSYGFNGKWALTTTSTQVNAYRPLIYVK